MGNAATECAQGVLNRPLEGGELARNTKKILNSGNEPKNVLKTQELSFSGAKNELVFEGERTQIEAENTAKNRRTDAARPCSVIPTLPYGPATVGIASTVCRRKSPARPAAAGSLRSAALRLTDCGGLSETRNWKSEIRKQVCRLLVSSFRLSGGLWKLGFTVDYLFLECSYHRII